MPTFFPSPRVCPRKAPFPKKAVSRWRADFRCTIDRKRGKTSFVTRTSCVTRRCGVVDGVLYNAVDGVRCRSQIRDGEEIRGEFDSLAELRLGNRGSETVSRSFVRGSRVADVE